LNKSNRAEARPQEPVPASLARSCSGSPSATLRAGFRLRSRCSPRSMTARV